MLFTPLNLEQALVTSVTTWTADFLLKSPLDRGLVPIGLTVYQGAIPSYQAGPETPVQPKAPSIAIRCSSFSYQREHGQATVHFAILTWDDSLDRLGYQDVSNILTRINSGLLESGIIGNSFPLLDDAIHSDLIEDASVDYHPYYLGMMEAKFGLVSPGSNDTPYNDFGWDTFSVGGVN